jgi:hypothetical protein
MSPYKAACQRLYLSGLMATLPCSTILGFLAGVNDVVTDKTQKNGLTKFIRVSGLTSIGVFTGITYPLSFPLLAFNAIRDRTTY